MMNRGYFNALKPELVLKRANGKSLFLFTEFPLTLYLIYSVKIKLIWVLVTPRRRKEPHWRQSIQQSP